MTDQRVTPTWPTDDAAAWPTRGLSNPHRHTAQSAHSPQHAYADDTTLVRAPVTPSGREPDDETDTETYTGTYAPRPRWDGVPAADAAWVATPARLAAPTVEPAHSVMGPVSAAAFGQPVTSSRTVVRGPSPASAPREPTPVAGRGRPPGTVTTRVAALIAAGAFVVGAAAAVLVGGVGHLGGPPDGGAGAAPGVSAPQSGSTPGLSGGGPSTGGSGTDGGTGSGSGSGTTGGGTSGGSASSGSTGST